MRVYDHFKDAADYSLLIATAKQKAARTPKEEDFLEGLEGKFETYGPEAYLSEEQSRWLVDIASRS